jgi:hypothetical protein
LNIFNEKSSPHFLTDDELGRTRKISERKSQKRSKEAKNERRNPIDGS